jgi:hypothetical protein
MITNRQLRAAFVDDATLQYFRRKLPDIGEDEVRARLEETLKFLFIASACSGATPVTREIDEVRHLWILHTAECAPLREAPENGACGHFRGSPEAVGNRGPREDVKMLALYVRNFGPLDPARVKYWLLATELMRRGWSVGEINDWLGARDVANLARTRRRRSATLARPKRGRTNRPPGPGGSRRETRTRRRS